MNKIIKLNQRLSKRSAVQVQAKSKRPSRPEAEDAVRTLLRWARDDPDREGLRGTPARVVRAYEEWFAGYDEDPGDYLKRTFEEVAGYDEIVVLRGIHFKSHCEHHLAPHYWQSSHRLSPAKPSGGHFKACAPCRRVRETPSNSRKDDG